MTYVENYMSFYWRHHILANLKCRLTFFSILICLIMLALISVHHGFFSLNKVAQSILSSTSTHYSLLLDILNHVSLRKFCFEHYLQNLRKNLISWKSISREAYSYKFHVSNLYLTDILIFKSSKVWMESLSKTPYIYDWRSTI